MCKRWQLQTKSSCSQMQPLIYPHSIYSGISYCKHYLQTGSALPMLFSSISYCKYYGQAVIYPHISQTVNVSPHNQQKWKHIISKRLSAAKVAPSETSPVEAATKNWSKTKNWPKVAPEAPSAVLAGQKCLCWSFTTKSRLWDFSVVHE